MFIKVFLFHENTAYELYNLQMKASDENAPSTLCFRIIHSVYNHFHVNSDKKVKKQIKKQKKIGYFLIRVLQKRNVYDILVM